MRSRLKHLRETAEKHGVAPGLHVLTSEQLGRRVGEGWRFIALASDVAFMLGGAKRTIAPPRRRPQRGVGVDSASAVGAAVFEISLDDHSRSGGADQQRPAASSSTGTVSDRPWSRTAPLTHRAAAAGRSILGHVRTNLSLLNQSMIVCATCRPHHIRMRRHVLPATSREAIGTLLI